MYCFREICCLGKLLHGVLSEYEKKKKKKTKATNFLRSDHLIIECIKVLIQSESKNCNNNERANKRQTQYFNLIQK